MKRLLSAGGGLLMVDGGGGERGGDAKRILDWYLVFGVDGCDESHEKADGSNMLAVFIVLSFVNVVVVDLRCDESSKRRRWMRRQRSEPPNVEIGNPKLYQTIRLSQESRCM